VRDRCAGGAQVRLNGGTEVRFANERQMEMFCGQLWPAVAGGKSLLEIAASDAVVVADDATFDLRCEAAESVLTVIEGTAEIRSGDLRLTISAGQSATIVAGRVSQQQRALDPLLASGWIHPLLVLKGPGDPELAARMNHILARLGQAKLSYFYEDEIRRLGDHCVLPLARYLESSRSEPEQPKRVTAARIIADVSQPRATVDDKMRIRMNVAAGLAGNGDLLVIASGWRTRWVGSRVVQGSACHCSPGVGLAADVRFEADTQGGDVVGPLQVLLRKIVFQYHAPALGDVDCRSVVRVDRDLLLRNFKRRLDRQSTSPPLPTAREPPAATKMPPKKVSP
jgi:hypothetical protein